MYIRHKDKTSKFFKDYFNFEQMDRKAKKTLYLETPEIFTSSMIMSHHALMIKEWVFENNKTKRMLNFMKILQSFQCLSIRTDLSFPSLYVENSLFVLINKLCFKNSN